MNELPKKSLFKVNEVCSITGVKPYVLRFWESEFEELSPITSSLGQKLYSAEDIEMISYVKKLLFGEKMSIEQAKALVREFNVSGDLPEGDDPSVRREARDEENIDLQKLFMAKERLQGLLLVTGTLKQEHRWNE